MALSVDDIKAIMNHGAILIAIGVVSLPFVSMLYSFVDNVTEDFQRCLKRWLKRCLQERKKR
ncbi:MAG: hypothetical protein AAGG48_14575 [Planctomycetota bacterium]